MRVLIAMRDVYVSHPAAPTVKTVPIDVSAHARVNQFVNRRKFVVSEMSYSYLRHYMSSGVHHPAVAKHDDVQRRVRSAALKHTLKGVFKKATFESTQSVAVLTQELRPDCRHRQTFITNNSNYYIKHRCHFHRNITIGLH